MSINVAIVNIFVENANIFSHTLDYIIICSIFCRSVESVESLNAFELLMTIFMTFIANKTNSRQKWHKTRFGAHLRRIRSHSGIDCRLWRSIRRLIDCAKNLINYCLKCISFSENHTKSHRFEPILALIRAHLRAYHCLPVSSNGS